MCSTRSNLGYVFCFKYSFRGIRSLEKLSFSKLKIKIISKFGNGTIHFRKFRIPEKSRNPSIYNILRWVAWTMGQTNRQPRVWCSKYYFFILFIDLGRSKLFIFIFVNLWKILIKLKRFLQGIWQEIMKKILGTSDWEFSLMTKLEVKKN